MGINDRDYMKRGPGWFQQLRWWLHEQRTEKLVSITVVAVSVVGAAAWMIRGADAWSGSSGYEAKRTLRVNINEATNEELQSLPGIGDSRAALIIAHRPYQKVDELERIKGIGPGLVNDLRPFLKTEGRTERIK